ncbi:type I methionyl aminopeptidase [Sulfoacidibacillus thermotolerans]|uniref:Methionine aminopeptidase n=1 Tax=Sulfoacidibacillus thermotolerans TaxID=1765684 RepID=A0A2U3DBH7_SULT2|nr:type I methionyl aminopeptidase [Sulfoacidibacillus thermotolerans]PWI58638.1 type I methionyl aminopeptidase [Sulfoacidibacillus thermotolerans]
MITVKSRRELEIMREAGRIVALAHAEIKRVLSPGISTRELDAVVESVIRKAGAIPSFKGYQGFPASSCISINEELVHGIPGDRKVQAGDIVTVDIGAQYRGYHGDSAYTYAVGEISPEAKRLLDVTEASLYEGIKQAQVGNRLSDISHAIQVYVEARGMSIVREYVGHGIGQEMHESPQIPNYGPPGMGPRLKPGMVLAIEPMVNLGGPEVRTLLDNWTVVTEDHSLCAHFEHTVAIAEDGPQLMTVL